MRIRRPLLIATLVGAVAAAVGFSRIEGAVASDHLDPDRVGETPGVPADIGDLYAWSTAADGNMVVILTFAGPLAPVAMQTATYDRDTLYTIHVDDDADGVSDHDIRVRFGQNAADEWGVLVENVPGASGPIVGAAGGELTDGPVRVQTGLFDDPFFFDLTGFRETIAMGELRFDPTRDFFAGQNISAIVVEFPLSGLAATTLYGVWATTGTAG